MFYFEDTTTQQDYSDNEEQLVFLDREGAAAEGPVQSDAEREESPESMLQRIRQLM